MNWNYILYYACKGGNHDIINLIIFQGANDVERGLIGACEGGHLEIAEIMYSQTTYSEIIGNNFDRACEHGHLNFKSKITHKYYLRYIIWSVKYLLINYHKSILNFILEDVYSSVS